MTPSTPAIRGRFAPSPTGPLHFGSLVAALGSWLDARVHEGEWHVRIDDLDPNRTDPEAEPRILRSLERHGLHWDGPVVRQSARTEAYAEALDRLEATDWLFPCGCTRRELQQAGTPGPAGVIYPGTCRDGLPPGRTGRALRVRLKGEFLLFRDCAVGWVGSTLEALTGDFVVRRADGVHAYHLACVVDDAASGFNRVVRGRDLLVCTPPQIHLQRLLSLPTPVYGHLPLAFNPHGQKLSKQNHAPPLDDARAAQSLAAALRVLGADPPETLKKSTAETVLDWGLAWARGHATFRNTQIPEGPHAPQHGPGTGRQ